MQRGGRRESAVSWKTEKCGSMGNLFASAYLLLMFCVYPFYVEQGYVNMGEAKNHFFLWVSASAFFILTAVYLCRVLADQKSAKGQPASLAGVVPAGMEASPAGAVPAGMEFSPAGAAPSPLDVLVALYGSWVLASCLFSEYGREALWGTEGWYMGGIPVLLLCGLYFLISRQWQGGRALRYGGMAASAVIYVLGICNSFSFYPLELEGAQPGFLATLGNINWFCGYLAVMAPFFITGFVTGAAGEPGKEQKEKPKKVFPEKLLTGGYAFLTFAVGFCQGSSSIFLWFLALFAILWYLAAAESEKGTGTGRNACRSWLLLVVLWGMAGQLIRLLHMAVGEGYQYEMDPLCGYLTSSSLTLWISLAAILLWLFTGFVGSRRTEIGSRWRLRWVSLWLPGAAGLLWFLLSWQNTLRGLPYLEGKALFTLDLSWGNGRGAAVYAAVKTFGEQSLLHKLMGVGPDCFASAAYDISDLLPVLRDNFGMARLTNAHNELLTALVNLGVFGAGAYVLLLAVSIVRFLKAGADNPLCYGAAAAIFCYGVHNLISFAQVLNYPYVFLLLGMGEALIRRSKIEKNRLTNGGNLPTIRVQVREDTGNRN